MIQDTHICKIIGITSGKGGVGKTFLTVNLAIAAAKAGKKVLIIDGDLGLANVHIVAGIYPEYDLLDFIEGKASLKDIIAEGPQGIHLIPGASGIFKLSNMTHANRDRLVKQLSALEQEYDLILIDTEAGISHNVFKFLSIADHVVVITTPDLTALADAYAVIKITLSRKINSNISLVVNRVRSYTEGQSIFIKINNAAEKFLNANIKKLGFIAEDHLTLKESIQNRKPVMMYYTKTKLAVSIDDVANKLFELNPQPIVSKETVTNNVVLNRFSMLLNNIKLKEKEPVNS